jgi:hypothetical protein
MELGAQGYNDYIADQIQNVALIRRDSGSVANPWYVQGANWASYSNYTLSTSYPVIKVIDAQGGIISGNGSKFSFSQLNKAPVLSAPADLSVAENAAAAITWVATDPDIDQTPTMTGVAWTAVPPAVVPTAGTGAGQYQFNASTGVLSWTPSFTQAGVYTVTVSATDGIITTPTTDVVTITVTDADAPVVFTAPTAGVASAMTVVEGSSTVVDFTATGEGTVTLALVGQTPAAPVVGTFDALTNKLTLAPSFTAAIAEANTDYVFVVKGTSQYGKTTDYTLTVTVTNANQSPVVTTTDATATVNYGTPKVITFTATDADGTVPTFNAFTVAPALSGTAVAAVNAGTYTITITPTTADINNSYTFSVSATDGAATSPVVTSVVAVQSDLVGTPPAPRQKGDVQGDGDVAAFDAVPILQYAVGLETGFTWINGSAINFWAADVSGGTPSGADGAVTAYDAASILYSAVNSGVFLPKKGATLAEVTYGKLTGSEDIMRVPIQISNTSNVVSAEMTYEFDANVAEVVGVHTNAPNGWLAYSNVTDGKVKVVMAGLEALTDGNILVLDVKMKDKEASFVLKGGVQLNADLNLTMESVSIRQIPTSFEVSQNYPNPFNPTTEIKYQISENTKVMLKVYNTLGQEVATIVNEIAEAGYYTARWDGTNNYGQRVTSGVYIYRLQAGDFIATKKMNLIK